MLIPRVYKFLKTCIINFWKNKNNFYGILEKKGQKFSLEALSQRNSQQFVSVVHIAAIKRRKHHTEDEFGINIFMNKDNPSCMIY